ncbi:MAG: SET domain-containing protein-lysine N-methyltransferase [Phycisphaeraceae bacterium]|nr:SET domain-containing protein-lysine N-methyltransferase [Phycisphaeraceae bacterium]
MIHPHTRTAHVNDQIGQGVFATTFIPKGAMTYVIDPLDIILPPDDPRITDPLTRDTVETYSYIGPDGSRIFSWDNARFVNHSCNPNTISTGYGFEIALRDIMPGEQITDDYGLFNITWNLQCNCGDPKCRKLVTANDPALMCMHWDHAVMQALASFTSVEQPLLQYLDRKTHRALMLYLNTGKGYRSVRSLQYTPGATQPHNGHSITAV